MLEKDRAIKIQESNNTPFFSFSKLFQTNQYGVILLILGIIPLLIYGQTANFELVWDDVIHTINNKYFDPINLENLSHFWTEIFWGLYIPVSYTLWGGIMELCLLVGLEANYSMVFHLINVLLHSINGILVFTLLHHFIKNKWYALIGTLFFLLHPIQVETVAWVSEFRGLLSFSFGFIALYLYLKSCDFKYVKQQKKSSNLYFIYGLLFFVLAILSKPSIIVIILFAVILEYYLYRPPILSLIKRIIPFMIPVLAIIILTTSAQGGESNEAYPIWVRPLVFSDSILFYIKKIVLPVKLLAGYGRTTEYISSSWWFYTSWIFLIGITGISVKYRQKLGLILVGAIIFLFGFITVSGLIQFDFQLWSNVADRYIYVSMFGIALTISAVLEKVKIRKKFILIYSSIIISGLTVLTIQQVPVWKNNFTLWNHTLKSNPKEYRALLNRGIWYSENNEEEKAITDYKKSLKINPDYDLTYYNIGLIFSKRKEFDKAIKYYDSAIIINENPKFLKNRAKAYTEIEQYALAVQDYYRIININGGDENVFLNMGFINIIVGNYELAISDLNKCLKLTSKNASAYYNRGFAYMKLRKFNLAFADFTKAIQLKPDYDQAIEALAIVSKLRKVL